MTLFDLFNAIKKNQGGGRPKSALKTKNLKKGRKSEIKKGRFHRIHFLHKDKVSVFHWYLKC